MDAVVIGSILTVVGALSLVVFLAVRVVRLINEDERKHRR